MAVKKPRAGLEAERRRHLKINLTVAAAVAVLVVAGAGLAALLAFSGGNPRVPDVRGMTYAAAARKVVSAGFTIEIDPRQDSSGDCEGLEVESQDPKPGTEADEDRLVTVRLKGLHESPGLIRELSDAGEDPSEPATPTPDAVPEPAEAAAPAAPSGRVVCLDPGHSNRTGSEIDPATGLNVGDNGGAPGELEAMWDLALRTKTALEGAGYTVRMTKESAASYASLRSRADTGNTCDIVIRLHYDSTGFTGVMRPPANAARCPVSDRSRVTVISPEVAAGSHRLASCLAPPLGLPVRDDTGGTSQGNTTPAGHPTALIGSILSRVPVVCIENKVSLVRGNPAGQDQVASQIRAGVDAYFGR